MALAQHLEVEIFNRVEVIMQDLDTLIDILLILHENVKLKIWLISVMLEC